MSKQRLSQEKNWYVIHTYSGYEDAVCGNLKQGLSLWAWKTKFSTLSFRKKGEDKNKKRQRKTLRKKFIPVMCWVEMIVTDDSWYVVRNTPNVTGFVGAGTTPLPVLRQLKI